MGLSCISALIFCHMPLRIVFVRLGKDWVRRMLPLISKMIKKTQHLWLHRRPVFRTKTKTKSMATTPPRPEKELEVEEEEAEITPLKSRRTYVENLLVNKRGKLVSSKAHAAKKDKTPPGFQNWATARDRVKTLHCIRLILHRYL